MSITSSDISWSSYSLYEGPFFGGRLPYVMPSSPDFLDKALNVVTAVEGGHFDSINMYDSCILSVGISQQCLAIHQLENLFAAVQQADSSALQSMLGQLPVPATFHKNASGLWRFAFADGSGDIETRPQMQQLFLCGATGIKNQWTPTQTAGAKQVAASFASLWDDPALQQAQNDFAKNQLMNYVLAHTKQTLFADADVTGYKGALKAAIISYSVNLPVTADKMLTQAMLNPAWSTATDEEKFELAMRSCALGSGVAIWPMRYRGIQPVLQALFGVPIPTLDDLSSGHSPQPPPPTNDALGTVKAIQQFLISQGYDLGPTGADGISGPKTRTAVSLFQHKMGLPINGIVDQATHDAMVRVKNQASANP